MLRARTKHHARPESGNRPIPSTRTVDTHSSHQRAPSATPHALSRPYPASATPPPPDPNPHMPRQRPRTLAKRPSNQVPMQHFVVPQVYAECAAQIFGNRVPVFSLEHTNSTRHLVSVCIQGSKCMGSLLRVVATLPHQGLGGGGSKAKKKFVYIKSASKCPAPFKIFVFSRWNSFLIWEGWVGQSAGAGWGPNPPPPLRWV